MIYTAITNSDGSIILTTSVDEKGLNKGFASIKSGAKSVSSYMTKTFAAITIAATAAATAITKSAVSAYAEYEQLIGGVETLFKGSAQRVIDYANDAFYTAGQSANEYMKTAISVSASLIQSLGGDTAKAADIANMAIIDMSDNVNKLGTDAERVKLAYAGFARQQYVLLDNLALGYQGTKTEMERLLRDAEALTGVKYDINNLADVYSAIHAIQVEMGIAGTTAKEAEKTITGSAKMMKAAYQDVLAAIAGGGDLDRAINNLVYSIQKYFENIVPVVQRSLVGVGRLIEKVAPLLVQNVASALIQAIPDLINAIYQMIIGLAKGIWQGIQALFSGGSGSVTAQIKTSVGGIVETTDNASGAMEELGEATKEVGKQAKKSLAPFDDLQILASNASSSAEELANTSVGGFGGIGDVSSEMSVVSENETQITFLDIIYQKLNSIKEIFLSGFWQGFQKADFTPIKTSLDGILSSLQSMFTDENILLSANNLVTSIIGAFGKLVGSVSSIGLTVAKNLLGGINLYLDENSSFITEKIAAMFDASTRIVGYVSDLWSAFADIFSAFADENGIDLTNTIVTIFSNAILNISTLLGEFGADVMGLITTPITDNQEELKTALDGLLGTFNEILTPIKDLLDDFGDKFTEVYDEHISPFITELEDGFTKIVTEITNAWNEHIKPVLDKFADKFSVTIDEHVKPALDSFLELIGNIADVLSWVWTDYLEPFALWMVDNFGKPIEDAITAIGDKFDGFLTVVSDVSKGITDTLNLLIDFMQGDFQGDWEDVGEELKNIWKDVANSLITFFENAVNGIIGLFENMINNIVNGINSISFDLPDFLGGGHVGFDLRYASLDRLSLPRLAQGMVVPPNREFAAILGDNKKEPEVVSPLSTMKQAVREELKELGMFSQTAKEEHYYLNETEVMRLVYKMFKGGERLNGESLVEGVY